MSRPLSDAQHALRHAEELLGPVIDDLHTASVAVTGAGGFIGLALCERLAAGGARVVGLDRDAASAARVAAAGAEFAQGDTTDRQSLDHAFAGCTGVIHTAALLGDRAGMAAQIAVNVVGTRNVLDAARDAGAERVVHLSSVATWGYDFATDLPEDSPPRVCGDAYVDTKSASQLLALRRGAAVVRPGDVYGPRSDPWTLRPVRALRAGTFALPGRGDGVITPVFIDDLVDCLVLALVHPDAGGQAVTAWDGSALTAAAFFAHYARMLGVDTVRCVPAPLLRAAAGGLGLAARLRGREPGVSREALRYITRRAAYPNDRARELLGWEPRVDLAQGMLITERWLRDEGLLAVI